MDLKTNYFPPVLKVIFIRSASPLCASPSEANSTEQFTVSDNSYSDEDWE